MTPPSFFRFVDFCILCTESLPGPYKVPNGSYKCLQISHGYSLGLINKICTECFSERVSGLLHFFSLHLPPRLLSVLLLCPPVTLHCLTSCHIWPPPPPPSLFSSLFLVVLFADFPLLFLPHLLFYLLSLHHSSRSRLSPHRAGWIMQRSALIIIVAGLSPDFSFYNLSFREERDGVEALPV